MGKIFRRHDVKADMRQPSSTWLLPLDQEYGGKHSAPAKTKGQKHEDQRQVILPGLTAGLYLKLVDHVARLMRGGKKRLSKQVKPILERLSLSPAGLEERVSALSKYWGQHLQPTSGG